MRKLFFLMLYFIATTVTIKAGGEKTSKIIFFRQYNFSGSAVDYKLHLNDSLFRIRNNSYSVYRCGTGDLQVSFVSSGKIKETRLKVEPNKTYYVQLGVNHGFWSAKPFVVVVDSASAESIIKDEKLKNMNNPAEWIRPKHRIGLNIDAGGGVNNIPVAQTTDGRDVNLTFGKQFLIGLRYANQFHKHFEYALDLSYENSSLSPNINNGKMNFKRTSVSATPFYILPIRDGYFMRLKFGAGLDYYIMPKLNIEMSNLMGLSDTWRYDNALGYHIAAIFELLTGKNFSIDYGLKWTDVNYKFGTSIFANYPTSDELIKPKGGSICLTLGMYYHF